MYFRKIATFAVLLLFITSVFPLHVSGSEERKMDSATEDRLRDTYNLEVPEKLPQEPFFVQGDWGMSNPAGFAFDLVYTALYPLPSIVQKLVHFMLS